MALKQTKGYANFRGIIGGIERLKTAIEKKENGMAYYENDKIKKITFSIKTSDDNVNYIRMMAFKNQESAWISKFNDKLKKSETVKIKFEERVRPMKDGWQLIGTKMRSKGDENTVSLVQLDAIDYLLSNFNDGDSVFVNASKENSVYNDKCKSEYELKSLFSTKEPVDFSAEDFEEQADFSEEFVFNSIVTVDTTSFVKGYTIDYRQNVVEVDYVVEDIDKEVAEYFTTQVEFGDLVKVEGIINNRVKYVYHESEESEGAKALSGRTTKTTKQNSGSRVKEIESENKSIQIIGIDNVVKGAYTNEDLFPDEEDSDLPF